MTCNECGAPLDPSALHINHKPGHVDVPDFGCDCPEVCADCCTDPDCPLRAEETTVTDPMLAKIDGFLTDSEDFFDADLKTFNQMPQMYGMDEIVRMIRWLRDREAAPTVELVQALLESENVVNRLTAERDAAYAVIRLYDDGWKATHVTEEEMWFKDSLRVEQWESMSPAEVDAIRRARAMLEEDSDE